MDEEVDGEMTMRTETDSSTVVIGMDPGGMTDIQITTMRDKGKLLYTMTDGEIVVMVDQAMGGGVAGTMTTRAAEEEEADQKGSGDEILECFMQLEARQR